MGVLNTENEFAGKTCNGDHLEFPVPVWNPEDLEKISSEIRQALAWQIWRPF